MSPYPIFLFLAGCSLLAPAAARASEASAALPAQPPPAVTVAAVAEQAVNPAMEHVGRVEAVQTVDLRARVQGYLETVAFEEGAVVEAGAVLYIIEQAPYRAAVNEARARLAGAEAARAKAIQYLKRLRTVGSGGVSSADLEAAVSAELQARAQVQAAGAALETAELNLGYTTIQAPIDGRIGATKVTRGNFVGPDSGALARIVQEDPIRVVYGISENDFVRTRMARGSVPAGSAGTPSDESRGEPALVRLRLPGNGDYPRDGRIVFMDNRVDPATGTLAVRAEFPNPDGILLPGQYVDVLVGRAEARRMPVVPQSAVLQDREGRYVLGVDAENRVRRRGIATGAAVGTVYVVESGLEVGEDIIVEGIQKARPGQTVAPVRRNAS